MPRATLNPHAPTRCLSIAALLVLALPALALAAGPATAPPAADVAQPASVTQETPAATAEATAALILAAGGSSPQGGIVFNPCYQFDDPSTGCYYQWQPSTYCCVSPPAWCPAICY